MHEQTSAQTQHHWHHRHFKRKSSNYWFSFTATGANLPPTIFNCSTNKWFIRKTLSIHVACSSALFLFHSWAQAPVYWADSDRACDREGSAKGHVYQTQLSVTKVTAGIAITLNTNTSAGGRHIINIIADKWHRRNCRLAITEAYVWKSVPKLRMNVSHKSHLRKGSFWITVISKPLEGSTTLRMKTDAAHGLFPFYLPCRAPVPTWPCSCSSLMERRLFSSGPPQTPCTVLATWPRKWRPPRTPPEPQTPTNFTA